MMTALSSEDQRQRGETLGADRYLVKSQVGIEDVVRVVHEVLEDAQPAPAPAAAPVSAPAAAPQQTVPPRPEAPSQPQPVVPTPQPPVAPAPVPQPPVASPAPMPMPQPAPLPQTPKPASIKTRIIQPIDNPNSKPVDINELLDRELAKEAGISEESRPEVQTTDQEKQAINEQIANFTPGEITADPSLTFELPDDGSVPPPPPPPPTPPNA